MSTSVTSVASHFPTAQNGFTTTLASTISSGAATVPLNSVAGYTNGEPAVFVVDPTDVTKKQTFTGIVDTAGVQVTSVVWTAGANQQHSAGATVVDYATATHIAMISKGIKVQHNQNGTHGAVTATSVASTGAVSGTAGTFSGTLQGATVQTAAGRNLGNFAPAGIIHPYAGFTAPTDWLICDGSAISRSTYANLFAAIVPSLGTVTMTIAAPGVVTLTAHNLQTGDQVYLTSTGALPTGLSANTLYYAVRVDANTFNLATSRANAYASTKITTSGTQSGTHSLNLAPYGLGDGSTTFNVPDLRGRVVAGNDSMGGTAASRLTLAQSQGAYGNLGATGGEQGHQISVAELASHSHSYTLVTAGGGGSAVGIPTNPSGASVLTNSSGSDTAHNNIQPTLLMNYIIKT